MRYFTNRRTDLTKNPNDLDADVTPDVLYSYTRTGQQGEVKDGQFAAAPFTAGAMLATAPMLDTTRYTYAFGHNAEQQLEAETVSALLTGDITLLRTYEGSGPMPGRASGYVLGELVALPTQPLEPSDFSSINAQATYTYDSAGRFKTVSDGTDTFTYGYLANTPNRLETVAGPVHTVTYSYEPGRNAMTNIENNRTVGGTGVVSNYAYTYNELGQRTERAQSGSAITNSTDTFSYDFLGQVTGSTNSVETTSDAWNPSYSFDMIGNRAGASVDFNGSKDYTANLLNQYTTITDIPSSNSDLPIHDEDGNLTSDGIWTYSWNGENRLINADNGTVSIDFEYDFQGRLVRKDDGTNIEVYAYDGWNRIAKYHLHTSSFSLHNSYLWGLDLSGSIQGAGGVGGLLKEGSLFPTFDVNGNIIQKLSSTGSLEMNVAYDPFGNMIDGSLIGEYGFSTKPLIEEIQWYYYGFRFYDPVTGRWPNRDPIGERGSLNIYGFVRNDPLMHWDVLGLSQSYPLPQPDSLNGQGKQPPPKPIIVEEPEDLECASGRSKVVTRMVEEWRRPVGLSGSSYDNGFSGALARHVKGPPNISNVESSRGALFEEYLHKIAFRYECLCNPRNPESDVWEDERVNFRWIVHDITYEHDE